MGYINDYPETPSMLHPDLIATIYNGQAPVSCTIAALSMSHAEELMILRGNHGKLSDIVKHSHQAIQNQAMVQHHPFINCMMQMQQFMESGGMPGMHPEIPTRFANPGMASPAGSGRLARSVTDESQDAAAGSSDRLAIQNGLLQPRQQLAIGMGAIVPAPCPRTSSRTSPLSSPRSDAPSNAGTKPELSPADQAARFLEAMKGNAVDNNDSDDDADNTTVKCKPASNVRAKAKANAKVKATAKAGAMVFKPVVALEGTRNQYLFRPGLPFSACGESSCVFTFDKFGGKAAAKRAADKHLK